MKNGSLRKVMGTLLAGALALGLAACGASSSSSTSSSSSSDEEQAAEETEETEAAQESGEVPTVTIWGSGGQEVADALQAIADAFNADPDYSTKAFVEIQYIVSGTSEQSLSDRLAAAYEAGETDTEFDLIALDDSGISTILAQTSEDFFITIDTSKIPNYDNLIYKDNVVGDTFIPYRGTCVVLAYNTEMVDDVPTTDEELYQWIMDNPGQFTYCAANTGGSGLSFVTNTIYNNLPDEARLSSDESWMTDYEDVWDEAFELLAELHPYLYQTGGTVQYPSKNAGSLDLLANKQIAMTPAYVNMVLSEKNMGTMPDSIALVQIDPAFSGALAGFCIPSIAGDQEAALDVIDYFLSYEAQAIDWNTMYASPVVDPDKLEGLEHEDWLDALNLDELRYFAIGNLQVEVYQRWNEEIAPLAQ